nr:enolase C-terminal domain-like protein [Halomonas socia]
MVDANQQWDRAVAQRMCRNFESFNLEWIEEPLDCYDYEGHAALSSVFDTPIATGEMLTSVLEHSGLINANGADVLMPDGPRVGGITPYLKIQSMAEQSKVMLAPHFAMELHIHLASTYYSEPWVEHFEWLEPLFNERLEVKGGEILVPDRLGIGLTLSDMAKSWVVQEKEFRL